MCRVSVIVPVYQVEAYLAKCLDSILAQTFTDFELILVDDGTRDDCPRIMTRYAAMDARIRCIHKENGGLSSARNAGLDIARGEYIAFVDSDDTVEPTMLADAVAAAQRTGAQLVIYNYRLVTEDGVQDACLPMKDETLDIDQMGLANYFYRYWMPYVHGQEAWCRLYRRDIIEQNHLAALAKPYVNYLQRGDSLMGMIKPNLCRRLITLSVRLTDYVKACGRDKELADVLPVLCYDKLICKGIRLDPSLEDVYAAMTQMGQNATLRGLLHALLGVKPLAMYTLKTGKGIRTQVRARMFAARWLRGDVRGAAALVQGREEQA